VLFLPPAVSVGQTEPFEVVETTVAKVHAAFRSGALTSRQLVQRYLDRIQAYDQQGPRINSIITLNTDALAVADRLDGAFQQSGFVGPLHGIPVMLKDQIDARGMPTTLGSVLFRDYFPDRDAFVTERLRAAGAIILGKVTLGESAGGDTHGSLFGSTRNPYALDRTVGGSSGGSGANDLDAIVYKAVEHQPTLIKDGINPPFVNTKGVPHLNAFLVYVPAIVVPAGFTEDNLPVGLTFMGRPYADGDMIALAYAYEQATQHRRPPSTTPAIGN